MPVLFDSPPSGSHAGKLISNVSYIIELKYAVRIATDAELEAQAEEGRHQLFRYSEDKIARQLASGTTLHRLLIQYRGWDMVRCEEV